MRIIYYLVHVGSIYFRINNIVIPAKELLEKRKNNYLPEK